MRTNKKEQLIEAALQIIEEDGLAALTYESLAAATGISKSGLIYHFPSRQQMMVDLNQYTAERWVSRLEESAGGSCEEVSLYDRLRALLKVHKELSSRADLIITIDATENPELRAIWDKEFTPWLIPPTEAGQDQFLIQLVADGLWLHNYVGGGEMDEQQAQCALDNALELVDFMESRDQQ